MASFSLRMPVESFLMFSSDLIVIWYLEAFEDFKNNSCVYLGFDIDWMDENDIRRLSGIKIGY